MHHSRPLRHRAVALARVLAIAACVLAVALGGTASAQERARDFISPRINKTQFQQFCQKVGLQSDQRQIASIAFTDYETTLNQLATRLDERAIAVGRQTVDDSLSGKARVQADELQRLRAGVYRVYLEAGPAADEALDLLVGSVEVLLLEDQTLKFDAAHRWLNREILLHPRANAASYQEYAGDGVDVLQMVDDARAVGGELAALEADELNGILNTYESDLDQVLIDTSSANRQGSLLRKIAGIEKDLEALKKEEQAALERWKELYDLNSRTVQAVAAKARESLGAAAGEAFKKRFDREAFTWLYPRRKPDRQIEWIRLQSTIAPDALANAEKIYAEYITKRDSLSRSAIDMMLKARNEFGAFLYAIMDQASVDERLKTGLYADLLKNTGEQSHLESTTSSQLESLLDDQTRSALRDAMRRPDRPTRPPASPR